MSTLLPPILSTAVVSQSTDARAQTTTSTLSAPQIPTPQQPHTAPSGSLQTLHQSSKKDPLATLKAKRLGRQKQMANTNTDTTTPVETRQQTIQLPQRKRTQSTGTAPDAVMTDAHKQAIIIPSDNNDPPVKPWQKGPKPWQKQQGSSAQTAEGKISRTRPPAGPKVANKQPANKRQRQKSLTPPTSDVPINVTHPSSTSTSAGPPKPGKTAQDTNTTESSGSGKPTPLQRTEVTQQQPSQLSPTLLSPTYSTTSGTDQFGGQQDWASLTSSSFSTAQGERGNVVSQVLPCEHCGRPFDVDRLPTHEKICLKSKKSANTRGVYSLHGAPATNAKRPPAKGARTKQRGGASSSSSSAQRPPSASSDPQENLIQLLQQRQAEIEYTLRTPLGNGEEIEAASDVLAKLHQFVSKLYELGEQKQVKPAHIFQELLARLVESPTDFDAQSGSEGIPMHQNKVLDRRKKLVDANVNQVVANIPEDERNDMLRQVHNLRHALKIKVEDANDLQTAKGALEDAMQFFKSFRAYVDSQSLPLYTVWNQLAGR
eukprot:TRINITY_DN67191_c9_g1_i1.p1 TRINITY_DN67191_c9_g1~~TRINITY_DN67191_c9_g1_i1.p1  ORF type:complete len:553 (+),score=39.76 TRINITY_DN67191_c9_g1_i1:31-1659(+)